MYSSKPLYSIVTTVSADEVAFNRLIRARIYKIHVGPKRQASGATQSPVQWVLGLFPESKAAEVWR